MQKDIKIGERSVTMKASAASTFVYQELFGSSLFKDLDEAINNQDIGNFSKVAYCFAYQAGERTPFMEWVDTFEQYDMNEAVHDIVDLWQRLNATQSKPKK